MLYHLAPWQLVVEGAHNPGLAEQVTKVKWANREDIITLQREKSTIFRCKNRDWNDRHKKAGIPPLTVEC
jgi:hypothetical protein